MIKIYYTICNKELSELEFGNYILDLPFNMRRSILKFQRWQDRQAALLAKWLLKVALTDCGLESEINRLKFNRFGRPYVDADIDFNISHSGCYIVCAVNTVGRIGIDVEEVKPISVFDFRPLFTTDEWSIIFNSDEQHRTFYKYWTIKEAVLKGDGRGLNVPMIQIVPKKGRVDLNEQIWFYEELPLFQHCITHIAFDTRILNFDNNKLNGGVQLIPMIIN